MKQNKIQRAIYEEYKLRGRVWADCPIQCGKSTLIVDIVIGELIKGKKVFVQGFGWSQLEILKRKIDKKLSERELPTYDPDKLEMGVTLKDGYDVYVFDEVYNDGNKIDGNIVCLRTRPHRLMIFTYKDMPDPFNRLVRLREELSCEAWDIDYNGGLV